MDLIWSPEDQAFREGGARLLAEKLTDEIREAGKLMTSVYADHDRSMAWQHILNERGWAAPAWPKQ